MFNHFYVSLLKVPQTKFKYFELLANHSKQDAFFFSKKGMIVLLLIVSIVLGVCRENCFEEIKYADSRVRMRIICLVVDLL